MTNLDIAEHRLPQDGRLKLKIQSRLVDFRVSTIPTYLGEKACLRILDGSSAKLDLKNLGFDEKSYNDLIQAGRRPYGMILTCGPTGSGKTTTLYSILNAINSVEKNLVTIEDPVEYAINGLNQVNVRADVGLTFAASLRSILRQDPDVILVGEIRDNETADIAVKSALTGHLVLSTLHTNSAVGCIVRLANMGVEPFLLASSMVLAASQRLIRKLCAECKEEYRPTDELLEHLGVPDDKTKYFRPKGCSRCNQSGYSGRSCVIETLAITPAIRDLITKRSSEKEIKEVARAQGMITLRENSIGKMRQGLTSPEEVVRVSMADENSK
jgi:type IV pilus assembly protein PilB